jgi:hypothetical protein
MSHSLTHPIHTLNKIVTDAMINPMVMDPIDSIVMVLILFSACENVNFMAPPFQTGSKFSHMNTQAADID